MIQANTIAYNIIDPPSLDKSKIDDKKKTQEKGLEKPIDNNDLLKEKYLANLKVKNSINYVKLNDKVTHNLDIIGELEPLKDKNKIVNLDEKEFMPISAKKNFKDGECVIKYRFKTDIDKSTFNPIKEDKNYGKNKDFFYVNGINTKEDAAKNTATELSKLTGQNVKALHNPTNGAIRDLIEVAIERLDNKNFDEITKKTAANFYETLSSGRELKIIAHSQGAAITSDALMLCKEMLIEKQSFSNENLDFKANNIIKKDDSDKSVIKLDKSHVNHKEKFVDDLLLMDKVNKIMSKVEVITLGGASSQDKFPNIKLVQVTNPNDPVPKIGGSDKIQTLLSRKTVTDGKISYVKNPDNVTTGSNFLYNKNIQDVAFGILNIDATLINLPADYLYLGKNPIEMIDYHLVDDKKDKDAYLNQNNVRSLIYNFGRRDF